MIVRLARSYWSLNLRAFEAIKRNLPRNPWDCAVLGAVGVVAALLATGHDTVALVIGLVSLAVQSLRIADVMH